MPDPQTTASVEELKARAKALEQAIFVLEHQARELGATGVEDELISSRLRVNAALRRFLRSDDRTLAE